MARVLCNVVLTLEMKVKTTPGLALICFCSEQSGNPAATRGWKPTAWPARTQVGQEKQNEGQNQVFIQEL